jgi:hypothetical protein
MWDHVGRLYARLRAYDGMRYAQRGVYIPAERRRRELLRLQAAERFARGHGISQIAHDPRVTRGFGMAMAPAWRDGGAGTLRSRC